MPWAKLAAGPVPWLGKPGAEFPFVLVTRLRSFRNFASEPFPVSASPQVCEALVEKSRPVLSRWGCPEIIRLCECELPVLRMLRERGLISETPVPLRGKRQCKYLALGSRADRTAWLNEVEHLTFGQVLAGLPEADGFADIHAPPSEASDHLPWAWSTRLGYLCSDPSRLGAGFTAEVLLHLPGLALSRRLTQVHNAMTALGAFFLPVTRVATGEMETALFRLRSGAGLGKTPAEVYRNFLGSVQPLLRWEAEAQQRCLEKHRKRLEDRVSKSLQLLTQAKTLAYPEFLALSSHLRLGGYLGLLSPQIPTLLEELRITAQAGHLQVISERIMLKEEEDMERANVVRLSLERRRAEA